MRSFRFLRSLVAGAAALLLVGLAAPAGAQEGLPVVPDPAECTVDAPTIDDVLAQVGATPVAELPAEEAITMPAAFSLPEGEPADAETVDAVTATVREALACINTGNWLSVFAFFSDDYSRRFGEANPISEAEVEMLRTPVPEMPAEARATLQAVREVRVLEDGRVAALVETIYPGESPPGGEVDFFVFVEEDGRWLIDDMVEDLEGQYPPVGGTPTP
jgi:hypothetical protein